MPELYIISTPIGNLKDITFRAIETLKMVQLIICEDTRTTKKLLNHYEIITPLNSFHGHSSNIKVQSLIKKIHKLGQVALVCDAGTPGISDPAYALLKELLNEEVKIIPIPGPTAFVTALQASAVPIHNFEYLGFLPIKKGRKNIISSFDSNKKTLVFYESVHRIKKTLEEIMVVTGKNRFIVVAKELTKMYEEIFRGSVEEAIIHFSKPKGEYVIIIPPSNYKNNII